MVYGLVMLNQIDNEMEPWAIQGVYKKYLSLILSNVKGIMKMG